MKLWEALGKKRPRKGSGKINENLLSALLEHCRGSAKWGLQGKPAIHVSCQSRVAKGQWKVYGRLLPLIVSQVGVLAGKEDLVSRPWWERRPGH